MTRRDCTPLALGRKGRLTAGLAMCTSLACWAQGEPPLTPAPNQVEAKDQAKEKDASLPIRYVYGLSLHTSEDQAGRIKASLKPQLGLQWGRWRLGLNPDPQAWSALSTIRREPTVGYEAMKATKLRLVVGLRLHNITTGDGFNALESGRLTLRGRLHATYQWSPAWTLAGELTHDLQNRGDGQTLTLAASRSWPLSSKDVLSWGTGIKWADAEHWRTPYLLDPALPANQLALANQLRSGLGSVSTGLAYRRSLTDKLVLVGGINASRSIGQLTDLTGTRVNFGAQLGLLWFGNW